MLTKNEQYKPSTEYLFLDQKRKRKRKMVSRIKAKFDIKPEDVGFFNELKIST